MDGVRSGRPRKEEAVSELTVNIKSMDLSMERLVSGGNCCHRLSGHDSRRS